MASTLLSMLPVCIQSSEVSLHQRIEDLQVHIYHVAYVHINMHEG